MKGPVKKGLVVDERGFSLTEVLVTMIIMVIVLFALYSLFDMTLRVFSVGNDKTEAVENSRLGLEKMKREIRAAFPYKKDNSSTTDDYLFWTSGTPGTAAIPTSPSTAITFGNDLNGNYRIGPDNTGQNTNINTEQITYNLSSTTCTVAAPCTLRRTIGSGTAQPVVEYVQGMNFTYCKVYDDGVDDSGDGCPSGFDPALSTEEGKVTMVRISLTVSVDRGIQEQPSTQTLTTDVSLRNRGEQ